MTVPNVSVIIPTYNSSSTLRRAVESALRQTPAPYELIIVDNASTDDTAQLIETLKQEFPIIQSIYEPRKGGNIARNTGMSLATGEWIQFLDADDELLPGKFQDQLIDQSEARSADLIYSDTEIQAPHPSGTGYIKVADLTYASDTLEGLADLKTGRTSVNLWRKSTVEAVGGWDEDRSSFQEYHLMLKMYCHGAKFQYVPGLKAISYREGETVSFTTDFHKAVRILRNQMDYFNLLSQYLQSKSVASADITTKINYNKAKLFYDFAFQYTGHDELLVRQLKQEFAIPSNFKAWAVKYVGYCKQLAQNQLGSVRLIRVGTTLLTQLKLWRYL